MVVSTSVTPKIVLKLVVILLLDVVLKVDFDMPQNWRIRLNQRTGSCHDLLQGLC